MSGSIIERRVKNTGPPAGIPERRRDNKMAEETTSGTVSLRTLIFAVILTTTIGGAGGIGIKESFSKGEASKPVDTIKLERIEAKIDELQKDVSKLSERVARQEERTEQRQRR